MYKTEATLGLIGSILAAIGLVLLLIIGLIVGILVGGAAQQIDMQVAEMDKYMEEYASAEDLAEYNAAKGVVGVGIAGVIVSLILLIAAVVLGFMGTAKLRADNKKGAILLIIAAVCCLIPLFFLQWWGIVSLVLFAVAGIMVLTKKGTPAQAQ